MDLHLVQNTHLNVCKFICNDACKLASKFYIIFPCRRISPQKIYVTTEKLTYFNLSNQVVQYTID